MGKFKNDLTFGEAHQDKIFTTLNMNNSVAEVKTERFSSWSRNDNLCIEVECSDKPSGLYHPDNKNVKWWIHSLCSPDTDDEYNVTFIFPIERVKNLVEKKFPNARKVKGGDGYKSTLVLLPLAELITQKNLT